MNLKESFRYQNYLDNLMTAACSSIGRREHGIKTIKNHRKSVVNSTDEDMIETVEVDEFIPNDTVIQFLQFLIDQKEMLGIAIGKAKKSLDMDIDAEIEANKFRQRARNAISYMLTNKPKKRNEYGTGYRFNVEGNQAGYTYTIEITEEELFDRKADKTVMRRLRADSDKMSETIDKLMVNTEVFYTPPYEVGESFEDVIEEFANKV